MYSLRNLLIPMIFASTLLSGCGGNIFESMVDNNSTAAKKEDARIALDKGNYTEAVRLLEELCGTDTSNLTCDEETQANLASAYIADATNLDVLQLIAKAEEAAAGTASSFTTVSTLLPITDINACASDPTACTITDKMGDAITILEGLLPATVPANPADTEKNLYLQLAVASAVDIAVTIGTVSGGLNTDGTPVEVPTDIDQATLTTITNDVNNIIDGVSGSGLVSAELTNDINNIKSEIDSTPDGNVTLGELQTYITNLYLQ